MITGPETSYNLEEVRDAAWKEAGRARYYMSVIVAAGFLIVILPICWQRFVAYGFTSPFAGSAVIGGLGEAFLWYHAAWWSIGPNRVSISPTRIVLSFGTGRSRVYDLGNRRTRVTIRGRDLPALGPRQWRIQGVFPIRSFMPREAVAAIVAAGRAAGRRITIDEFLGERRIRIH
jgi:hypothetical protein